MSANRYMMGAAVLAARPRAREAVGFDSWDWRTLFYDPAGGMYRYLNQSDSHYSAGTPQAVYWAQQRAAAKTTPWATAGVSRQQAAQQLQQVLRQQQAANLASFQQQLAQMSPAAASSFSASVPRAPAPSPYDGGYDPSASAPVSDGTDAVVGAAVVGEPALVVRVTNWADVIKKSSALGNLAYQATPELVTNLAYGQMRDELKKNLAEKGVIAEVTLAASAPNGKIPSSGILLGAALGAGAVGLGAILWRLIRGARR